MQGPKPRAVDEKEVFKVFQASPGGMRGIYISDMPKVYIETAAVQPNGRKVKVIVREQMTDEDVKGLLEA